MFSVLAPGVLILSVNDKIVIYKNSAIQLADTLFFPDLEAAILAVMVMSNSA